MRIAAPFLKKRATFSQLLLLFTRDKKTSTDLAIRPLSFQITQYCADYDSSLYVVCVPKAYTKVSFIQALAQR